MLDIFVEQRNGSEIVMNMDRHAGRRKLGSRIQQCAIIRSAAQTARQGKDVCVA
jgi:hypothetical protein